MLRVVVPHAFGQHQLVGPLTEFLARFPKVSVEWLLHDTPPNFVEEGVDCAIRVGGVLDPSNVAIKIAEVPRIVVAAPELLGGRKIPRKPEALAAMPWIALGPYYRNEVLLHNAKREEYVLAVQPRVTTDSLYALRSAALRGVGVAALSAWVVEEDLARGALLHLVPDWQAPALPVYLVYPFSPFYPARLRSFIEVMRHAMDELPWHGHVSKVI
jgi:DNA-binding transcriptional LysR family regulator